MPSAPKEPEAAKTPTPIQRRGTPDTGDRRQRRRTPPRQRADRDPGADASPPASESGPSIASLIEGMSGPTGGWRIQIASVKSEDIAKSTWARLQAAHGDVLANLRMQPAEVDLGDKGVWYRVQAGPLDEKQAQSVCGTLKTPQDRLRRRPAGQAMIAIRTAQLWRLPDASARQWRSPRAEQGHRRGGPMKAAIFGCAGTTLSPTSARSFAMPIRWASSCSRATSRRPSRRAG